MRKLICALLVAGNLCAGLYAQAPASDVVVGSGSYSPIVADLDRSLAFYNALFGITPPATFTSPAFSNTNTALLNFLGTPTAQIRFSTARIPGTAPAMNVEIVDFKDIERKAVQPRLQDPGATRLILMVRDVDAALALAKEKGATAVTTGGTRAAVVRDPDGFFIELRKPDPLPQVPANGGSNVLAARVGLTVANMDATLRLYRDILKMQVTEETPLSADGEARRVHAKVPGSPLQIEFVEFRGADRKPIGARIQDPGATRLQLRVRDVDATVNALKAAGGTVITTGGDGGPINMSGLRVAVVQEPNNLFLVIMSQAGQR